MGVVRRVYVEKKQDFAVKARELEEEIRSIPIVKPPVIA